MGALFNLLTKFWALFVWWFVVAPWERALRVRLGATITEFGPGLHFRIPHADVLYRQAIRLHFVSIDPQTVTTTDNQTITFAGVFGYTIENLRELYQTIQSPVTTLQALVAGALSQYVSTHPLGECAPDVIEQAVVNEIDITGYGLANPQLSLTTYARVKTYRLIMDRHEIYSTGHSTSNPEASAATGSGVPT